MPFLNEAEKMFWDNVNTNALQAKSRAKPKARGLIRLLRADELLRRLSEKGIAIDKRTLQRYVAHELVTEPERTHGGKGTGPVVTYSEEAIAEAATAAELMPSKHWGRAKIAAARRAYNKISAIADIENDAIWVNTLGEEAGLDSKTLFFYSYDWYKRVKDAT